MSFSGARSPGKHGRIPAERPVHPVYALERVERHEGYRGKVVRSERYVSALTLLAGRSEISAALLHIQRFSARGRAVGPQRNLLDAGLGVLEEALAVLL